MTYKVTVTEDVTSVSVSGDTTSINLTGEQTEISVVNPATSVTFNPSQSFSSTNVQDALFEAHKMIGQQTNDYSVTLQEPNKFEIQSGSDYARLKVSGGVGSFGAELVSSDNISLLTNGTNLRAFLEDTTATFYNEFKVEGSGSITDGILQTNNTSGDLRHHYVMKSSGSPKGFLGVTSTQVLLGKGNHSVAFSAGFFGGSLSPATNYGSTQDALIDLGTDTSRFKNLYLSDDLYANNVEWANNDFTFLVENLGDAFAVRRTGVGAIFAANYRSCHLYYSGDEKLETTTNGVVVTGTAESDRFYCTDKTGIGVVTSHLDKQLEIGGYDAPTMRFRNYTFDSNYEEGDVVGAIEFYENANDKVKASIQYEKGTQFTNDKLAFKHKNSQNDSVDTKFEVNYAGAKVHNNFLVVDDTGQYSTNIRNTGFGSNRYLSISDNIKPDGIFLGTGTTSADLLDDYEEGTWTPTIWNPYNVTLPTFLHTGHYVKIGANVTLYVKVHDFSGGSSTLSAIAFTNLPFSPKSGNYTTLSKAFVGVYQHKDLSSNKTSGSVITSITLGDEVLAPSITADWNDTDYFIATITYPTDA